MKACFPETLYENPMYGAPLNYLLAMLNVADKDTGSLNNAILLYGKNPTPH